MDLSLIGQADAGWFNLDTLWAIFRVALGLGFVVFVHELGHFLVAKACGVKCEKFYVGFDFFDIRIGDFVLIPRALVKFKWGETEYGLGIIPLGGYVKMLGQDDNPSHMEEENRRSRGGAAAEQGPVDRERMDPRSYQSKTVLQRMSIISAGVVFNMFFAVILAAIAFRSGVSYEPAIVGSTINGGPAWEANLDDAKIVRIGTKRFDDGYAPFTDIIQEIAIQGGHDQPMEIEFIPFGETQPVVVSVKPEEGLIPEAGIALIGVQPQTSCTIAPEAPYLMRDSAAERAVPAFAPRDTIVAINDEPVNGFPDVRSKLVRHIDDEVTIRVRRDVKDSGNQTTAQEVNIQVQPNALKVFEFAFEYGDVARIQKDSPAERAGLQVGDRITQIDGVPIVDIQTLDQQIIKQILAGKQEMKLGVSRLAEASGRTDMELVVEPRIPHEIGGVGAYKKDTIYTINALGIAVPLEPVVSFIQPGSKAESVGLEIGDRIANVRVHLPEQYQDLQKSFKDQRMTFPIGVRPNDVPLSEFINVATKSLPVGVSYKLTINRDGKSNVTVDVETVESTEYHSDVRGVVLTQLSDVYNSPTWSDALVLGSRQVWTDFTRMLTVLGKLVTGSMPATSMGGIVSISRVATAEASESTSRLLLFLTMLSANLAIVNMLPIPVLDGGHMMFLAYEGIMRRPVTERVQIALSYMGLFIILGLMVFVTVLDVGRLF